MKAAIALLLAGVGTARADVELRPSAALRVGVQHTAVDKDDGAPAGNGPRFEAAGELAIGPYFAVSATTGSMTA